MPEPTSLLDPEVIDDPYPFYRKLCNEAPVFWDPKLQVWVIRPLDDVVALGHDPPPPGSHPGTRTGPHGGSSWRP